MDKELRQYIDFYKNERDTISANSAEVLNAEREKSAEALGTMHVPSKGAENYHVTDIPSLLSPDYGINIKRISMPMDAATPFKCDVPNLNALLYYQCNDEFRTSDRDYSKQLPEGVIIGSLREIAESHKSIIEKYYNRIAPHDEVMPVLNTLLAQDGVVVYLPKNSVVSRPIQVVNVQSGGVPTMVSRRMLIIAEENAQAKIVLCDHSQSPDVAFLVNQVIEIHCGASSNIEIYDMEESSETTRRVSGIYARQQRDSQLTIDTITLLNGTSRNNVKVEVAEKGCNTLLYGIGIGREKGIVDNNTYIQHHAPHCQSSEQYKYLLDGESRGCFGGKIYVGPGADKVESYQSNNNIIASSEAKMYTKPQLEIYTDDVKCSHGATTGQLDENAMFYMQSRGIPAEKARQLLMQAFMEEVVERVNIDILRDRLKQLVGKRLSGEMALCGTCGAKCAKK